MADMTYIARATDFNTPGGGFIPPTQDDQVDYQHLFGSKLAIFNQRGSNDTLYIKSIDMVICQQWEGIAIWPRLELSITSDVPSDGEIITPFSMDTNNTLPSQIVVRKNPKSSSAVVKRHCMLPIYGGATGAAGSWNNLFGSGPFADVGGRGGECNWPPGLSMTSVEDVLGQAAGSTTSQPKRIDEGITFGIYAPYGSLQGSVIVNITFRVVSTNQTFHICTTVDTDVANNTQGVLTLTNGSGSGVVLDLLKITFQMAAYPIYQNFEIIPICSIFNGIDITPVPLDTANDSLPAQILIKKDCLTGPPYQRYGGSISPGYSINAIHYPSYGSVKLALPFGRSTSQGAPFGQPIVENIFSSNHSVAPIILPEGFGIAITSARVSLWQALDLSITFTKIDNSGAPAAVTTSFTYSS